MFATYLMDFEQGKFIMRNLENAYPHVDRIYVMHSTHSFANTSQIQYENTFDLSIIRNSPFIDKITIIEGEWPSDVDTRNAALQRAKEDNVDFLMVHDADEYYFYDDFIRIINFVLNNPKFDVYSIMVKAFWKSFKHILINHDGSEASGLNQTVFNVKQCKQYNYVRDVWTDNIVTIPDVFCYHGSYVLTDAEVYRKIHTWAHSIDFDVNKWYNEVWLPWTPESKSLHPIWPWAWREAAEYTGQLPEVLKDFK